MSRSSRRQVHLVTQARTPKSEDIGYRERRYLIMMGIRVACFLIAILMVAKGLGWLAAFPAVGAIAIPYFAVVFANGGREPNDTSGFREYQPNLPDLPSAPDSPGQQHLREDQPGSRPGVFPTRGDLLRTQEDVSRTREQAARAAAAQPAGARPDDSTDDSAAGQARPR